MAGTKQKKTQANIPDGYAAMDLRPKQVHTEVGTVLHGTLGAIVKSKNEMPDYRSIQTEDGLFFVPSHAALQGVLSLDTGRMVYLECVGGAGTKASPWEWVIAAPPANGHTPF